MNRTIGVRVNTKIRSSKNDLILLSKEKSDKRPWNSIQPVDLPEIDQDFEVGTLSKEELLIEKEFKRINNENKMKKIKKINEYENNHKSQIDWGEEDEYFEKYFLDNINEHESLSSTRMETENN